METGLLILLIVLYVIQLIFVCGLLNNDDQYRDKWHFLNNLLPGWFAIEFIIWTVKKVREL